MRQLRGLNWVLMSLVGAMAFLGLILSHCALKIDDPVGNLQDKINSPTELTDSLLVGDWVADSTYTLRDSKPIRYQEKKFTLTFFRDGRFRLHDDLNTVFPGLSTGYFRRRGDSLFLEQEASSAAAMALAKLTFVGNYLRLYQPSQLRYSFYHKIRLVDTVSPSVFLDSGFWMLCATRDTVDNVRIEKRTSRFEYLYFREGQLKRERWQRGLPDRDSGAFQVVGESLFTVMQLSEAWVFEAIHTDSLRLWPLRNGHTDSGFAVYSRLDSLPKWHRDFSGYVGYWRGDSLRDTAGRYITQYESYFDMNLSRDGNVQVKSQSLKAPRFTSWDLDSGNFLFMGASNGPYSLTPNLEIKNSDTLFQLSTPRNAVPGHYLDFYATRKDSTGWGQNPLARFPLKNHALLHWDIDSLAYLSISHWSQTPERAEFSRVQNQDTLWMVLNLPTQSTLSSSQAGFRFIAEGRDTRHGFWVCSSRADLPLTLRLSPDANSTTSIGTIQGSCQMDSTEIATTDSVLTLDGTFRIDRKITGALGSRLW